ncbi:hypothetical protein [Butyribacter sp.]|uniref:hypothetical protein n=1 Tax=Butyribacter sp. TaxID=2822465 RepID=UPI002A9D30EA|nr:hypothetical protein [Butyribacter sp.]
MKKLKIFFIFLINFIIFNHFTTPASADADSIREASIYDVPANEITSDSNYNCLDTYCAETPTVVNFWDYKGDFNVASYANSELTINRYDKQTLTHKSTITITDSFNLFGNVICDDSGNYYAVWGNKASDDTDQLVLKLCKYDYDGNLLAFFDMHAKDTDPYAHTSLEDQLEWGTKIPFDAGNCQITIDHGILCCNYAREMYNGHQSNHVFYADTNTMTRLYVQKKTPYCSHSFDQDVIGTSDGGFLVTNQGDAFPRGFLLTKVASDGKISGERISFHFRQGSNRDHGYNETYAQLGGVIETNNSYILCASSEKTLTINYGNPEYCGNNEARNLFLQFLKKDFYTRKNEDIYNVKGETRKYTRKVPVSDDQLTDTEKVNDYGVVWLTNLDDEHYVCNPKILNIDKNKFAVLWEELSYDTQEGDSYYEILDETGKILIKKTKISGTYLLGNDKLTYKNGSIYWATTEYYNISSNPNIEKLALKGKIHMLDISEHNYKSQISKNATCTEDGILNYICEDCGEQWASVGTVAIPATGHNYVTLSQKATYNDDGYIRESCENCGDIKSNTTIASIDTISLSKTSYIYNGKVHKPTVTVKDSTGNIISSDNYNIRYSQNCTNAGSCSIKLTFSGNYSGTVTKNYDIQKASADIIVQKSNFAYSKTALKHSSKTFNIKPKTSIGKITYKSSTPKITVNAKGRLTIKSGMKSGTYTVTIKAAGNKNYNPSSKKITIKIK